MKGREEERERRRARKAHGGTLGKTTGGLSAILVLDTNMLSGSCLCFMSLSFPFCKMGMVVILTSEACSED